MSLKRKIIVMLCVIAALLVGSVVAIILMKNAAKDGKVTAYLYRDNELIKEIDLSEVKEPYQIRIEYEQGEYNVLEVREGSIGIVEASCPDHLCKNMGFISDSVMPITCLPNHLVVKVVRKNASGEEESATLDGIVY